MKPDHITVGMEVITDVYPNNTTALLPYVDGAPLEPHHLQNRSTSLPGVVVESLGNLGHEVFIVRHRNGVPQSPKSSSGMRQPADAAYLCSELTLPDV